MKGINLKTIIVLIILVLVGVLGVLGMNTAKTYMSGASADTQPKNVTAVPGADGKSAVINWSSDKAAIGVVEYGTTPASLLLRGLESEAGTDHKITLSPLKSNTNYYFRIKVGEEVFDNSGIPYSFKTKAGEEPVVVAPTAGITLVPVATTVPVGACSRTTDYNKDGTVNSLDYLECLKGKNGTSTPVPSGSCQTGVDYDGNGVVNSLDRIKCLQGKP